MKRTAVGSLLRGSVILLLAWAACARPPTDPGDSPGKAELLLYASVTGTDIRALVAEVTAADIPEPLIFNIPVVDDVGTGTITVPTGSDRTITVRAYDANQIETHRGAVTINVVEGTNPAVSITLLPLVGEVPIEVSIGTLVVTVDPASPPLLPLGQTLDLTATVTDGAGNVLDVAVSWGSTQPLVASVDSDGQVTAMGSGDAEIVASYANARGTVAVQVSSIVTRIVDLGTLGGRHANGWDINNLGHVVGYSVTASEEIHAFLWTAADGMRDLGTLGGSHSYAAGINDLGQVVGYSSTASGDDHAFLWTATDGMRDLGTLGGLESRARDINEHGQVVGTSRTASRDERAFLWTAADGMHELGTFGAYGINDLGQVVGGGSASNHAVLWTAEGGMRDLGTLSEGFSFAFGINDLGQIVGNSRVGPAPGYGDHAFLWTVEDGMQDLGTLGGENSRAYAINDLGQVAGWSESASGRPHAIVWTAADGMHVLGTLGGYFSTPRGINDLGQLVGYSSTASGESPAVLWEIELPPRTP
jgi:probable HAF family extracellular repeat protein